MLLYYITDRSQFNGDETSRRGKLLAKIVEAARSAVDFIQLRERDLSTRELVALAQDVVQVIRASPASPTRLLINSRTDVAIAVGAEGVHLRSMDVSPKDVREIWKRNSRSPAERTIVTVACHTLEDVALAARNGADFAVFGPIFEKIKGDKSWPVNVAPVGLDLLREACRHNIRVIALGGMTPQNASRCTDVGAAGVAGIRLFQENHVADVIERLR